MDLDTALALLHAPVDEQTRRAINFAKMHKDGEITPIVHFCDLALVGLSRTQKSPTQITIAAYLGKLVWCVPFVSVESLPPHLNPDDDRVPQEEHIDPDKVVVLDVDPYRLWERRKARKATSSEYVDVEAIKKERTALLRIALQRDWHKFLVTGFSIEENISVIARHFGWPQVDI
ncbi:hypothetical protein C4568_00440 [Candidatus Parcubacteria bacterium]|nr:MAG: hypothetical protein C4568_00440 [Candidatus Parcubacteria bacterium]